MKLEIGKLGSPEFLISKLVRMDFYIFFS